MIFDLVKDFTDVFDAMPKDHPRHRILKLLDEAIRRDVHFIDRHPTTLFQCLWNTCWWYDCAEAAGHYDKPDGGPWELPEPRRAWPSAPMADSSSAGRMIIRRFGSGTRGRANACSCLESPVV